MNTLPPEPHPDDNVSANTIRQIIRALRALTPIEGANMRLSRGPNGTTYNATVPAVRGSSAAAVPAGCFEIVMYKPTIGDPYRAIVNRHYRVGHLIREMSFSAPPEVPWGCDADHPILAIVASADQSAVTVEVERFADMSALIQRSKDYDSAVIPLYQFKFDDEGEYVGVEIDFRNMPAFTITEDGL